MDIQITNIIGKMSKFSVAMKYSQTPCDRSPTVFTAHFNSYDDMKVSYRFLRYTFDNEPRLTFTRSHRKPIVWCKKVGDEVPLHLDVVTDHPTYVAAIRFEDPSYLKHYSTRLSFGAHLRRQMGGWMVKAHELEDAKEFVKQHNEAHIPQSDTLEWDAWYEPS